MRYHYPEKRSNDENTGRKAVAATGLGAAAGAGTSAYVGGIGITVLGTGVGIGMIPLTIAGGVVGLAGYGLYRLFKK